MGDVVSVQDVLAFVTVALAVAYLAFKLVLEPKLRARRPDVPARSLVRKNRSPSPPRSGGCH